MSCRAWWSLNILVDNNTAFIIWSCNAYGKAHYWTVPPVCLSDCPSVQAHNSRTEGRRNFKFCGNMLTALSRATDISVCCQKGQIQSQRHTDRLIFRIDADSAGLNSVSVGLFSPTKLYNETPQCATIWSAVRAVYIVAVIPPQIFLLKRLSVATVLHTWALARNYKSDQYSGSGQFI